MANPSSKEILKASQRVQSNTLRTQLCFWLCIHLVGVQVETMLTVLGCSTAGSAHWSHLLRCNSPPSTRNLPQRRQRNHFLLYSAPPHLNGSCCLSVIQQAGHEIKPLPERKTCSWRALVELSCNLSQQCIRSHPAVPKRVLCERWVAGKEGKGKANWQIGKQRDIGCILHLVSLPPNTQRLLQSF